MPQEAADEVRLARFLGAPLYALRADRRGSIAVYTAFAAVGLMGFAGLAVDVAAWQVTKRQMQGAADQAAIGAVVAYLAGGGDSATFNRVSPIHDIDPSVQGDIGTVADVTDAAVIGAGVKRDRSAGYLCVFEAAIVAR